jgi:hypothetical protein
MFFSLFSDRDGKKGDMSLQVIVIAVICIVVLVVLIMIFTGKTRSFGTITGSCDSKGGQCLSASELSSTSPDPANPSCPTGSAKSFGSKCDEADSICCVTMED